MLSSLDSSNTECFLDLFSSFSKVSARIIVSPYPFKSSVFFWDLSTRFCTRSELHQHSILTIARLLRVLTTTLTHYSMRCHDSMLGDTTNGSITSSSNNLRPPRLKVPVSSISADRSGAASSIIISRMTTLVLEPGCGSTCISTRARGQ